jgi:hypothetical protein
MRTRYPQPYRGQPRPHYPKPHRQIQDLQAEREQYHFTIIVIITFGILLLGIGVMDYFHEHSLIALCLIIAFVIFFLGPFAFAILDGLRSIDKFRPGYDIDISEHRDENLHGHSIKQD